MDCLQRRGRGECRKIECGQSSWANNMGPASTPGLKGQEQGAETRTLKSGAVGPPGQDLKALLGYSPTRGSGGKELGE